MELSLPSVGAVVIGDMLRSERGYVCRSWVKGYVEAQGHGDRSGSPHKYVYTFHAGEMVDKLLSRPHTQVYVARDADCDSLAYGWLARERDLLHWCYVKHSFRRCGVASALLAFARERGELEGYSLRSLNDDLAEQAGLVYRGRGVAA